MKIGILGCKGTTLDLIHNIRMTGKLEIAHVVTLNDDKAEKNNVAFFEGPRLRNYCVEHSLPLYISSSYNLKDPADLAFFENAKLDLLLVIGWERLLPNAVLDTLTHFACGMHGSAYGLPRGRGRSPMNWALLTGETKFITYLFRYTQGMDDGDLLGFRVFDIMPYDNIGTLHTKNRIAMGALIHSFAPKIADGSLVLFPQPNDMPTYFPKRSREDGFIDWNATSEIVHRLVRAVAPPYPGALTRLEGEEVSVRDGQPFDSGLFDPVIEPGTVVDINLSVGHFVVKTANGAYLVKDSGSLDVAGLVLGQRFESVSAETILANIRTRYPFWVEDDQKEI